jgi:hypothetical protein
MLTRFSASTRIARAAVVACASLSLGACCCGVVDTPTEQTGPAVCREPETAAAVAPMADSLLVIVSSPALDTAQTRRLNQARSERTAGRVEVARLSPAAQQLVQPGREFVVSVSATRSFAITDVRLVPNTSSYTARVNGNAGEASFMPTGEGIMGGLHSLPGGGAVSTQYAIHPIGGGLHVVVCVDPSKFPPD